jgi:hypothetical protein
MLSGTGYPSGENYPAGTGMELFFYPHAGTGNPTGKILRVRVRIRVSTTRRVRTRCHLEYIHILASTFSLVVYLLVPSRDSLQLQFQRRLKFIKQLKLIRNILLPF